MKGRGQRSSLLIDSKTQIAGVAKFEKEVDDKKSKGVVTLGPPGASFGLPKKTKYLHDEVAVSFF